MDRREFLQWSVGAAGGASLAARGLGQVQSERIQPVPDPQPAASPPQTARPFKHSVCQWCFDGMDLAVLCDWVKTIGITSIELVGVAQWPILAEHGISCAVSVGPTKINRGLNRIENHEPFLRRFEEMLPRAASAPCGPCPMMIVFSGNNAGITDDEGLKNCEIGLKQIVPLAERAGITLVMELLNSKIDHPDYMARHTRWGVELVKRVGSPRFKLLYDVYHMQIMEGDVIRTIQDNIQHIAHFHVAGVPGRHEIDETQELNYRAIAKAIRDAGYTGYIGYEFLPRGNAMASLKQAVEVFTP